MTHEDPEHRSHPDREHSRAEEISRTVAKNVVYIRNQLAQEGQGWSTGPLDLVQPEGEKTPAVASVHGTLDDENRTMLDRVYSITGARAADKISYAVQRGSSTVEQVDEIAIGERSHIKEITLGVMQDKEFSPLFSYVLFLRR